MALRKSSRSSAMSMASREAAIISTPNFSSTPSRTRSSAVVEGGLAAHRRQQRVRPLLLDDARDRPPVDRLDVDRVRHVRVGHDRRRIRVDEDDAVALLAQRLAGLGAGIIEFAGLADDDRAGADDQDALDVGALAHQRAASAFRDRDLRAHQLLQAAHHQEHEVLEERPQVVRARARLRVALEAERRPVRARDALQRAVEQRPVRRLQRLRQRRPRRPRSRGSGS